MECELRNSKPHQLPPLVIQDIPSTMTQEREWTLFACAQLNCLPEHQGPTIMRKRRLGRQFGRGVWSMLALAVPIGACIAVASPCATKAHGQESSNTAADSQ